VATIGDSTFFHAGVPALINAVFHQARFILVILDNATTAMTGHQPTPRWVSPPPGNRATGVHPGPGAGQRRRVHQRSRPLRPPRLHRLLKEADAYCRSAAGGVAVVIAKHPCLLDKKPGNPRRPILWGHGRLHRLPPLLDDFECPALSLDEADGRVAIDEGRCVGCGVCVHVCPEGAIEARAKE